MITNTPETVKEELTLALREPEQQVAADVALAEKHVPLTPAQARVDSVADVLAKARAQASLLKLTPEEVKILKADFPDDAFKMGAGGDPNLIYIEHAFLRDRFDEAIGMCQWSLIRSRPHWAEEYTTGKGDKAVRIYADCALIIRGCLVSEAIGEMSYFPSNSKQTYGDAAEGSETAAFRRCAKKIGVGLQAWKKDFCPNWKERQRLGQQSPKATTQNNPPRSQAAGHAQAQSSAALQSPETRFKNVDELLEAAKAKWLAKLKADNLLMAAWAWAVDAGVIMNNERLEAANATKLFVSVDTGRQDQIAQAAAAVVKDRNELDKLVLAFKTHIDKDPGSSWPHMFIGIYGTPGTNTEEPEQPPKSYRTPQGDNADQPIETNEWFWNVFISIPRKGQKKADYEKNPDTIKSLYDAAKSGNGDARKRLFGLANDWKCEPREYNGRTYPPNEGDKQTRKALDAFMEYEQGKKSGAVDAMRQGVEADEPPF